MPELPEVETVKRGLEPVWTGRRIQKLTLNRPNLRIPFGDDFHSRVEGKILQTLHRRGKYIWADLDSGETLVIHLGMSGRFGINPKTDTPHDHVIFQMESGVRVTYTDPRRFGMMFIVTTGSEHLHPAFAAMGPEPLSNDFHADYLYSALQKRSGPIKTVLLDQSIVAGLGNIYVCEALYDAGISPLTPANKITRAQIDMLIPIIREVLAKAIESGGSSLRDHLQVDGQMGYFQHHFKVYDRAREKCPETGGTIIRIVQAGRSTFYCPEKQK